jgi:hypothetical protein
VRSPARDQVRLASLHRHGLAVHRRGSGLTLGRRRGAGESAVLVCSRGRLTLYLAAIAVKVDEARRRVAASTLPRSTPSCGRGTPA